MVFLPICGFRLLFQLKFPTSLPPSLFFLSPFPVTHRGLLLWIYLRISLIYVCSSIIFLRNALPHPTPLSSMPVKTQSNSILLAFFQQKVFHPFDYHSSDLRPLLTLFLNRRCLSASVSHIPHALRQQELSNLGAYSVPSTAPCPSYILWNIYVNVND